jgi:hypothetical protein
MGRRLTWLLLALGVALAITACSAAGEVSPSPEIRAALPAPPTSTLHPETTVLPLEAMTVTTRLTADTAELHAGDVITLSLLMHNDGPYDLDLPDCVLERLDEQQEFAPDFSASSFRSGKSLTREEGTIRLQRNQNRLSVGSSLEGSFALRAVRAGSEVVRADCTGLALNIEGVEIGTWWSFKSESLTLVVR